MNEHQDLWQFEDIAVQDAKRAANLYRAPVWADLMQLIGRAFRASLATGGARFGFDESGKNRTDLRAVIQFPVGEQLFDWFFNALSGYRAQFRLGLENGAAQNSVLVTILRGEIEKCAYPQVSARRLSPSFADLGPMVATVRDLLVSLDPALSKLWFCERLIGRDGSVTDLHVFKSGPKLLFKSGSEPWSSLYANESSAWIDLKGAFVSKRGLYQLKDPAKRMQGLQARGTA